MPDSSQVLSRFSWKRVALSVASLLVAAGCVSQQKYDRLATEYHAENQARRQLEDDVTRQQSDITDLKSQNSAKDAQVAAAEQDAAQSKERVAQLEKALTEARKSVSPAEGGMEGVDVIRTDVGFAYRVKDELLFGSGDANITEKGRKVLASIAKEIKDKGYKDVRIDGHTDSDPVKKHKDQFPRGNMQLAAERALSVYQVLVSDEKVPEGVLSLAAYGPNRPVAQGDSDAAKAKNRRVEIQIRVPNKS